MTNAQARKRLAEADRKMQMVSQSASIYKGGLNISYNDQLKLLKMGADLRKMAEKLK